MSAERTPINELFVKKKLLTDRNSDRRLFCFINFRRLRGAAACDPI
jgi:hypothetical protein